MVYFALPYHIEYNKFRHTNIKITFIKINKNELDSCGDWTRTQIYILSLLIHNVQVKLVVKFKLT